MKYSSNSGKDMNEIMAYFFSHQMAFKILHFQSAKFTVHKITDEYLACFACNFDKFMEVLQGEKGERISVSNSITITAPVVKESCSGIEEFKMAGGSNKVDFIAGYTIEDGVIQYADETNADALVVITNARKGLNHLIKGSISENLANHSRRPVLTFKL